VSTEEARRQAAGAEEARGQAAGAEEARRQAAGAEEARRQAAGAESRSDGSRDRPAVSGRRFALLVNPASAGGRALEALPHVHATLDELGARHRTVTTRSIDHAFQEARQAASEGETVVALGGDGLLRPLAGALKGTEGALAIIPCGRGNDLARVLGIPDDPGEAARVAVEGEERLLDVANVEGTPYMGIASFGFDSDANRTANEAKLVKGNAVYLYAALRALVAWKPARFTVSVDGERREFTGYTVAVGNSKAYGGGMYVFPMAELDDGKLDVIVCKQIGKLRFLAELPRVFKGAHVDRDYTEFFRGEEIEVSADRPFVIYADGDPIGATPAVMRVERRCLRVVAPA
jgi:YegS/Rv2252/BmrU family lipid kinase